MNPYEYINKEWIVSPTARRVYRTAAAVSLIMTLAFVAAVFNEPIRFLKPLVFIGTVGTAVNLVGMEYFLFRFDDSHALKQVLWFLVMIFLPVGPALYCFIVYSHAKAFEGSTGTHSAGGEAGVVDHAKSNRC
jgi:hypothetical protein